MFCKDPYKFSTILAYKYFSYTLIISPSCLHGTDGNIPNYSYLDWSRLEIPAEDKASNCARSLKKTWKKIKSCSNSECGGGAKQVRCINLKQI